MFRGTSQNGAANHNSQLFIAYHILIIANQRPNVFAGCAKGVFPQLRFDKPLHRPR